MFVVLWNCALQTNNNKNNNNLLKCIMAKQRNKHKRKQKAVPAAAAVAAAGGGGGAGGKISKKRKRARKESTSTANSRSGSGVAKYEKLVRQTLSRGGSGLSAVVSKPASGHLTPLQSAFEHRLQEAKFRMLNEKMYSMTGSEAQSMFRQNPQLFSEYHSGYRLAVQSWDIDPADFIVQLLNMKGMKGKVVADMGCGEAKIAQRVKRRHLGKVHSFDLVALNEHVTACDIAHTAR